MSNLDRYNRLRSVPQAAKKEILAGRLKGKTDINPMWRIKALTEEFGPCGIGWGYTIDRMWIEEGVGGERCAFAQIGLWYRTESGERSEAIPGIGGNMLISKEKNGLYVNDECYKMALTDAISVAAKALGVGADVYWETDKSKYGTQKSEQIPAPQPEREHLCSACGQKVKPVRKEDGTVFSVEQVLSNTGGLCVSCYRLMMARDPG